MSCNHISPRSKWCMAVSYTASLLKPVSSLTVAAMAYRYVPKNRNLSLTAPNWC